jgi:predicted amidophosphoribosyltransferase
MPKMIRNKKMPYMDYNHGFYDSERLFLTAKIMTRKIMNIAKKENLKTISFISSSSSGAAITTAVMAILHKKIKCQHSYISKRNWSFRSIKSISSDDSIVIKNKDHLIDEVGNPERNIFILDDCIHSGSTVNAIYQQMIKLKIQHKLNRIIVQSLYCSSCTYEWLDKVEYYSK